MIKQKLQIEFPADPIDEINKKLDKFFYLLFTVGLVFVITLIVMVATLVVDSFHINSTTYKEYSQKTESVETTQKANEILLKQVQELSEQNKQNQELILKQQNQIIELIKKK
jgi:hypothetical protein